MGSDELDLATVLEASPAAVLVVDLETRQVVHVNDVAEQLAPGTTLPVDLNTWSDVAELRDPDGAELSETTHPLSRIARAEPVAGQAVSAARRSAMGARREPLWMVAMPMTGAPMLEGHALVVLIPLRHSRPAAQLAQDARAEAALESARVEAGRLSVIDRLRDRALDATALAVTVADAVDPEQPLVWVNPAFTATTGYAADEVLGRNCRFLQGPDTGAAARRRLREAVDQGVSVSVTLLNYRKDGTTFWNQVDLSPVRDTDGRIAHYVGMQTDVTNRVEADAATLRALGAEREARADAESARSRVAYLIEAVNHLSGTLDVTEGVDRLLASVVPYLADWALVLHGGLRGPLSSSGRHRHTDRQPAVARLAEDLATTLADGPAAPHLLGALDVRLVDLDGVDQPADHADVLVDADTTRRIRALGTHQVLVVPLAGRSVVHDVLVLGRTTGRPGLGADDVDLALDLGRRAGLFMENATLFHAQSHIAEVLQRSLLSELPRVDRADVAARYLANESSAQIGGDFYELFDHGDRGFGIVVGDVSGHDILSAAAMGHLKGILRAVAHDHHASPATVLEQVDRLMVGLGMPTLATAVFVHAVPHGSGWRLTWSAAGHPPLIVRHPDGTVEVLSHLLNDPLLGVEEVSRTEHRLDVAPGATVLAYTDGLVERRGESLDVGTARLVDAVVDAPRDVEALCDHVLGAMAHSSRDDDIALLAVTLRSPSGR